MGLGRGLWDFWGCLFFFSGFAASGDFEFGVSGLGRRAQGLMLGVESCGLMFWGRLGVYSELRPKPLHQTIYLQALH